MLQEEVPININNKWYDIYYYSLNSKYDIIYY